MSLKPSFRSLPVFLTGCLLAISFTIVNCQKAPNRNGVKAKPDALNAGQQKTAADAAAADAEMKQVKAATKQCDEDLMKNNQAMLAIWNDKKIASLSVVKKSETEVENIRKMRTEFLNLCKLVSAGIDQVEEKSCLKDAKLEAKTDDEKKKNVISLLGVTRACETVKNACDKEHTKTKCDSDYKPVPVTDGKRVAGTGTTEVKSRADEFKKANLKLSKAAIELTAMNRARFVNGQGFSGGKVVDNALELAGQKKVVCGFSRMSEVFETEKSYILKVSEYYEATKENETKNERVIDGDLHYIHSEFKGDAVTMVMTRVDDKSEGANGDYSQLSAITCLNMKKDKIDVAAIKSAFGSNLEIISEAKLKEIRDANEKKIVKPAAAPAAKPDPAKPGAAVSDADKAKQELAKAQGELSTAEGDKGKLKKLEADLVLAAKAVKDAADELAKQPEKIKLAEKSLQSAKDELAKMDASTPQVEKTKKEQEVSKKDAELKADQAKLESLTKEVAAKKIKEAELKVEIAKEKKAIADLKVKVIGLEIKVAGSETTELKSKKDAAAQLLANAVAEVSKEESSLARVKEAAGGKPEAKKDESEEMKSTKAKIVEAQARIDKAMPLQKAAEDLSLASNKKVADIQATITTDESKLAELKKSTPDGDHSAIEAKIAAAKLEKQSAVTAAIAALKDEAVKELELRTAERAIASLELYLVELEIQANKGVETTEMKDKKDKAATKVQQKQAALEKTLAAKKDMEESFK